MNPYYKDYNEYLNGIFPDTKVQKISVNTGFSCPNRDGTISTGGCIYCVNNSFTPGYCMEKHSSVKTQIEAGKQFFARKYPDMKYMAYFQSFTNTFSSVGLLEKLYNEAIEEEDVVGLVIGTRPDCIPDDILKMIGNLGRKLPVFVELGAESSHDRTLKRINRGHNWKAVDDASRRLADAGIHVGLHLIAGLPGETPEDVLRTVKKSVSLPVESLKLHQLQILKTTPLAEMYLQGTADIHQFSIDEYLDLCCRIIDLIPRRICIERFLSQAPADYLIWPKWGLKNHEFINLLHNKLKDKLNASSSETNTPSPTFQ